ncbi:MAG: winged helix-turn-helix transcriptional regulator [Roseiflexaceae bacterium]|nr:winged helix-turn-helix transcriptional regulator [Roseiflexaceae bacterium]
MSTPTNTTTDGFLIGSLLGAVTAEIEQRVLNGYQQAGFAEIGRAQAHIFRLLPPSGCRVTELAALAHTSKQAMGYLVNDLEQHDYLERVPDSSDGRAQIVRRTARGWAVNQTARGVVEATQTEWAEQIGTQRMHAVLEGLGLIVAALGVPYQGSVAEATIYNT